MTRVKTIIEHDFREFTAHLGTIKSTKLGIQDHGVFTASITVEWKGGGISAGGYVLDEPVKDSDGKFLERQGTDYGADHIMRILETAGVESWEQLPGKLIYVLFEGRGGLGSTSVGIAGATNEKVLIFKDHAAQFTTNEESN